MIKQVLWKVKSALLTHPANAPVLPCWPLLSGSVPPLSPMVYKCVQDKILEHFKVQGVNKPKHSWGEGLS